MKQILFITVLFLVFTSCKKSKPGTEPKKETTTINPMKSIRETFGKNETSDGAVGNYQVGIQFVLFKSGTISKLGLRSPSSGTYRVQLYTFVANDTFNVNYPLISDPQRLAYVDITIDAAAAQSGTAVWATIPTVNLLPLNSEGSGKVRHYCVCFNDLDKTQYQYQLTGTKLPIKYNNQVEALSLYWYSYTKTDDTNKPSLGGGFRNLIYGDVQFEFVTELK